MTRTHLTQTSQGPSLNQLLERSGETLQNLESRLTASLDKLSVGDICLKHIEYDDVSYPIWCIMIEDDSIRAYDTHQECIQVHAYRGLPSVELFTMKSSEERKREAEERLELLQKLQQQMEDAKSQISKEPLMIGTSVEIKNIEPGSPGFFDKFFSSWGKL